MSKQVKGVSWYNVVNVWQAHYASLHDSEAEKACHCFFDPQKFFAPTASTYGIPMILGKVSQSRMT